MFMGSKNDPDFLTMLLNEGIPASKVNILPSSFNFDDLITGKVDAFNSYLTNEPFFLVQRGIDYTVINPRQLSGRFLQRHSFHHRGRSTRAPGTGEGNAPRHSQRLALRHGPPG